MTLRHVVIGVAIVAAPYVYLTCAHAEYLRRERKGFSPLRSVETDDEAVAFFAALGWPLVWTWFLLVWLFLSPRRLILAVGAWRERRHNTVKQDLPDEQVYR